MKKSSDRSIHEISSIADCINLPKTIVDRANSLLKQVQNIKRLNRMNAAKAPTCLYIACRQEGVPRTFKELCALSGVGIKQIGRCFKLILSALQLSVDPITTTDFMSRFCSDLGLAHSVQEKATHLARKIVELNIVPGFSPISLAAAAIYTASEASDSKKTQKEVGDITGVSLKTISRWHQLIFDAKVLFPADFVFTTPIAIVA